MLTIKLNNPRLTPLLFGFSMSCKNWQSPFILMGFIVFTFLLRLIIVLDAIPWDILKTWDRTIPCQSHPHLGGVQVISLSNSLRYLLRNWFEKVPGQFQSAPDISTWGIGLHFFNLDYFNLKPIGGAYHINIRHTRIQILFFRSFLKVWGGGGFAGTILLFRGTILNTYYT